MPIITPEEIRTFIQDQIPSNYLLDATEFTDERCNMAIKLMLSAVNVTPPFSLYDVDTMPASWYVIAMYGCLAHLFKGQSAFKARNHLSYSDGGLTIPVEEQFPFYLQLAEFYESSFMAMMKQAKISQNLESGWGDVHSDYAHFPVW